MRLATFALALTVLSAAPCGAAEQPMTVHRIGYLAPNSSPEREESLRAELRRQGFAEGRNIAIDYRIADNDFDRLPALAAELVARKVDVIVAVRTQASIAAKQATSTIPIVMVGVGDPVRSGMVASLARPGANVTGTSTFGVDIVGKQVELVREFLPGASRVATLSNPANSVFQRQQIEEAKAAAARLGVRVQFVEASTPGELDRAFASFSRGRSDAMLVLADPLFAKQARQIGELATKYRVPAVSGLSQLSESGLLASYGPDFVQEYSRAAGYVARILKGAKPADLPVEQMANIELVINARSAKSLGIAIPASVRARASRVID
jgi:putative ABC transport system substrate-binding protein